MSCNINGIALAPHCNCATRNCDEREQAIVGTEMPSPPCPRHVSAVSLYSWVIVFAVMLLVDPHARVVSCHSMTKGLWSRVRVGTISDLRSSDLRESPGSGAADFVCFAIFCSDRSGHCNDTQLASHRLISFTLRSLAFIKKSNHCPFTSFSYSFL